MSRSLRNRPIDAGRARARFLRQRFGEEVRTARVTAGLSQAQLAQRAGVGQALVSRAERGGLGVSLDLACRLAVAAGCDLGVKLFPGDGVPLRDSGQLAIVEAIVAMASPSWRAYVEQPVSESDRRAADLVLHGTDEVLHIEVERRLVDLQAQLRAATLKRDALAQRYSVPVRLVLALPDRRSSRDTVERLGMLVGSALPVRSARIRRSIVTGDPLGGDGIFFCPIGKSA